MDHYTPRYSRGTPNNPNPKIVASPTYEYQGQVIFTPADPEVATNGYKMVEWWFPSEDLFNPLLQRELPIASQVALFAQVDVQGGGGPGPDQWDQSIELVLVPATQFFTFPFLDAPNGAAAAWLWGPGFDMSEPFRTNNQDPDWVMTVSGPRNKWFLAVRTGMLPVSDPGIAVSVFFRAYLLNETHPSRDRINPRCTVPPFDLDGNYLFGRNGRQPIKQPAQNQREWFSKQASFELIDLNGGASKNMHIFGGPWLGQVSATGIGALTVSSFGMDGGQIQLATGANIAAISDPARYDHSLLQVQNSAGVSNNVLAAIGLTSPTQ